MSEIIFNEGGLNQRIFETMWRFNQGFWFEDKEPKNTTNLCQWGRVVIIWPFFKISAFLASAFALQRAVAYAMRELGDPVVSSNFWSYMITSVIVIVLVVAFVVALIFIKDWIDKGRYRRASTPMVLHSGAGGGASRETPWYKLIWTYVAAVKQKVCPVIRYVKKVDGEIV